MSWVFCIEIEPCRDRIFNHEAISDLDFCCYVSVPPAVGSPNSVAGGQANEFDVGTSTQKNGKPSRIRVFRLAVDGGDKVYEGEESGKKAPRFEVNSPVQFALDRNHLYVKDTQGKTHKLPLLKTTRKEAEPPR